MAARRGARVSTGRGNDIVVVNTPPSTPARRSSGRRRTSGIQKAKRRRRSSSSSAGGGSFRNRMIGLAIGGAAYGFLERQFPNLPRVPILGKSGTVAIACYFLGPKHQLIRDTGMAAAVIAGYTLGTQGSISGDESEYEHGLAAEA